MFLGNVVDDQPYYLLPFLLSTIIFDLVQTYRWFQFKNIHGISAFN